ncbi:MAG: hypothetical protein II008_21890 [Oscillospiraceae bacterium]|nr:hypothetical protein [Oscillospiraceae bacterium]
MTPIARGRWSDIGREYVNGIGSAGEAAVAAELVAAGFHVYTPVFCCPETDLIAELHGKLIRVQVKTNAGNEARLRFSAWNTSSTTYTGTADWLAFHSLHYGITAFLKPEEAGCYPTFRYRSPENHQKRNSTIRYAKDYLLERVIKEITQ